MNRNENGKKDLSERKNLRIAIYWSLYKSTRIIMKS